MIILLCLLSSEVIFISQWDILDFLKVHRGVWFTSKSLSFELGVSVGCITTCLKSLRKFDLVSWRLVNSRGGGVVMYEYSFKDF